MNISRRKKTTRIRNVMSGLKKINYTTKNKEIKKKFFRILKLSYLYGMSEGRIATILPVITSRYPKIEDIQT